MCITQVGTVIVLNQVDGLSVIGMSNHLLNPTLAVTVLMNLKSQCISARISVLQIDICTVATLIYNILYCVRRLHCREK